MNKVLFYSGCRLDQTPRKIIKDDEEIEVYLFQEMFCEDFKTGLRERIYIVNDKFGKKYRIKEENGRYIIDMWK
uniref:Uncharacterized protein n=1 Tax=candidate division WOR-3 bacterium TaxID=2052148 RepID=A0A7C4YR29_UNCW3